MSTGSAVRPTGTLSPVRVLMFTRTPWALTRRQSAGTSSPADNCTKSPGTRPLASISASTPPRITRTRLGSSFSRAARARSARYSCQKLKVALIQITPKMAQPRVPMPSPGWAYSA